MSPKKLKVEQDLQEQARILDELPDDARKRLNDLYLEAGLDVPDSSDLLHPDAPRLIDHPSGLALSGGGIRSATFNLGVLQALHRDNLLGGFDYLSTVSGGGYIGGFWSKWRALQQKKHKAGEDESAPCEAAPSERAEEGDAENRFPGRQADSIRHLRSFSNFLRPRLSLISFETGRMVTGFIVGLVPTLLVTLGVMSLALISWLGIASFLIELSQGWATLALLGALFTAFVAFQIIWSFWAQGEENVKSEAPIYVGWLILIMLLAGLLWFGLWPVVPLPVELRLAPVTMEAVGGEHLAAAILPALTLLAPFFLLVILRSLITRFVTTFQHRRLLLTTLESALSRTLFLTLVWCGVGVAWVGGQVVAGSGLSGVLSTVSVSGVGSGLLLWARRFLRPQPNKPGGGRALAFLGTSSLQLLAYLTLLAFLLLVASLISMAYGSWGVGGLRFVWVVSLLLSLCPFLFNPQEIGFHSFYRQRLVRAYLGAADKDFCPPGKKKEHDATLECRNDDAPLSDMPAGRPLHLICCAANDLAGDPIQTLHRGAGSSVLSGLGIQVEETWQAWADPSADSKPKRFLAPSLGSAMTASAAAFNSHMGSLSMKLGQAATFLLTALNLRLGMWTDNPRSEQGRGRWIPSFYRELLGLSDLKAARVHLSDGAHFDNLALYELIRRRCLFILVSDCGGDPDYAFDSFANVVRRVRTDFGVEIELDPEALRPDEKGRARQAVVGGVIKYPAVSTREQFESGEAKGNEHHEAEPTQDGLLILVKPTITGSEPADVLQYSRRNKDFPQETTADQFYDEEQWEAYRRLGEYAMAKALAEIKHMLDDKALPHTRLRWALIHGQQHWLPRLELDADQCSKVDRNWTHLESRLRKDQRVPCLVHDVLLGTPPTPGASPDDPLDQLRHMVSALHQMEGVLRAYQLDHGQPRPQNYGWINRFGRWATSEAFHTWWPWLSPTATRRLRRYLEQHFHLLPVRGSEGQIRRLEPKERSGNEAGETFEPKDGGYAFDRWRREMAARAEMESNERDASPTAEPEEEPEAEKEPDPKRVDTLYYAYYLRGHGEFMAALAEVTVKTWDAEEKIPKRCEWHRGCLHFPPGLWGIGLAESFIQGLAERLVKDHLPRESETGLDLKVTFDSPPATAELTAYAGADFQVDWLEAIRRVKPRDQPNS